MSAPLLAVVGRPNVGKSTLYNRLVGGRPALVHGTPGLTRDRRYGAFEFDDGRYRVVDTGGLDPDAEADVVGAGIHRQARAALAEADAVIFVVDGRAGVTPGDERVAEELRRLGVPAALAVNKIDHPARRELVPEFYALGFAQVFPISAEHNLGIEELLDYVAENLGLPPAPAVPEDEEESGGDDDEGGEGEDASGGAGERSEEDADPREHGPVRVAFAGKPNAGKSSLVNRLVGAERALVHDAPGTTTDPVDSPLSFAGREYILVDTAGLRRRAKVDAEAEKLAGAMAMGQIERADVAVLVIDGEAGPSEQDARLAGAIQDRGKGLVLALNKADRLGGTGAARALLQKASDELHFAEHAPRVLISATRGDGVGDLMETTSRVAGECARRIPTAELNRFFAEVCEVRPPPVSGTRPVRIHYLTQGGTSPPTFLLWANQPSALPESYRRFVANQLRERYGFRGAPLRVVVKRKGGPRKGAPKKGGPRKGAPKKGGPRKGAPKKGGPQGRQRRAQGSTRRKR